jgi:hypothetical protein
MRRIIAVAALGLAFSTFGLAPATAQEAERSAAVAACTVSPADEGACTASVEAFIAAVAGLPQPEADAALAGLVLELATASTPATAAILGAVILLLADAIADPDMAAAAAAIAEAVATGTPLDPALTDQLASPS